MGNAQPRIRLYWSKKENDLMVNWDPGTCAPTARYLMSVLSSDVLKELETRGYDTTTLRFQIRRKPKPILDVLAEIE